MTKTMRKLRRDAGGVTALVPERRCDHYVGWSYEENGLGRMIRRSDSSHVDPKTDILWRWCPLCGEKL